MKISYALAAVLFLSAHKPHPCHAGICGTTPTSTVTATPTRTPTPTLAPGTPTPTPTPTDTPGAATPTPLTITVASGGNIQTAVNSASCGTVIVLESGGTYTYGPAPLILINHGDCTGNYITITSDQADQITGRLDPSTQGSKLAKLIYTGIYSAVETQLLANHYKLIGLDITTNGASVIPNIVTLGDSNYIGTSATWAQRLVMSGFVFDRDFIHDPAISQGSLTSATTLRATVRAMQANVADTQVLKSYLAGFTGHDLNGASNATEDILMDVGPGPLTVTNNYLEAFYSSVFIGGTDAPPNPSHQATLSSAGTIGTATFSTVSGLSNGDLVAFQCSTCNPQWEVGLVTNIVGSVVTYTPQTGSLQPFPVAPDQPGGARWDGYLLSNVSINNNSLAKILPGAFPGDQPKNWIELKSGDTIDINRNIMTTDVTIPGNLTFTPRNQNGSSPWIVVNNVTFRNNRVNSFKDPGMSLQGKDNEKVTGTSSSWSITNNLFLDQNPPLAATFFLASSSLNGLTFDHNTVQNDTKIASGSGVTSSFTFSNNIVNNGSYGFACFISPFTSATCWPGFPGNVTTNVIIDNAGVGGLAAVYPADFIAPNAAYVQFNPDYSLAPSSPYKGMGSGGSDPGVDVSLLP